MKYWEPECLNHALGRVYHKQDFIVSIILPTKASAPTSHERDCINLARVDKPIRELHTVKSSARALPKFDTFTQLKEMSTSYRRSR